jgi:2-polyprenyl-6-methoxyphenol hydroxylase-like FAD-dependent oxidoreductase
MARVKRVLVVGGGVAGPVLAIFLRSAGIDAVVLEGDARPNPGGAGLSIAVNGMRVLRAAGVLPAIDAETVRLREMRFENQAGRLIASMPEKAADAELQPVLITRATLQKVLADAAVEAGASVYFGKQLVDVQQAEDSVCARFADGTTFFGDLIVGADGIRSRLRQCILPDAPKPEYTGMMAPGGFSPYTGGTPLEPGAAKEMHLRFGQRGFFGFVDVWTARGPRTMWWSTSSMALPSREEQASATTAERRQRLLELHRGWAEPVEGLIASAEEIQDVAIHDVRSLPTWSAGRAVLIGDAAHAVAPHSGQGASMALEDAMLLAKMLREFNGGDLQDVLRAFESERRPRTDRVIAMGRRNARQKEDMPAVAYWIMQQIMRIIVPIVRRRRMDWLLDYSIEW